jgi:HEAT repeat protein
MIGGPADLRRLRLAASRERSDTAKLGIYTGLWSLGERSALPKILQMLSSRNYRVRCAAAETLSTLADKGNQQTIVDALRSSLTDEPTLAARTALRRSLESIRRKLSEL